MNVKKKSGEKSRLMQSAERKSLKPGAGDIKRWGQAEMNKIGTQKNKSKAVQQKETGLSCEEVLEEYGHYLSSNEAQEIKEHKWVYFLGKILERKKSKMMELQRTLPKGRANGIADKRDDSSHFL